MTPALIPASESIRSIRNAIVVLPLVPVIPTKVSFPDGFEKNRSEIAARAFLEFSTSIIMDSLFIGF